MPEVGHEPVQRVEGRREPGLVEAAAAQVDPAAALVEDAEGRAPRPAGDDELGLVAVVRRRAGAPGSSHRTSGATGARASGGARRLVGQLCGVRAAHEGARAAAAGVEVVALHGAIRVCRATAERGSCGWPAGRRGTGYRVRRRRTRLTGGRTRVGHPSRRPDRDVPSSGAALDDRGQRADPTWSIQTWAPRTPPRPGRGVAVVTGAQTDACIRSTLHGALVRGYDVTSSATRTPPRTSPSTARRRPTWSSRTPTCTGTGPRPLAPR